LPKGITFISKKKELINQLFFLLNKYDKPIWSVLFI
jgi:hypothetical protein